MGNLINPNLIRLNNNIFWKSHWTSYQTYSYILSHDYILKSYINWFTLNQVFKGMGWSIFFSHYKVLRYNNFYIIVFFFRIDSVKEFLLNFFKQFEKNSSKKNLQYNKDVLDNDYIKAQTLFHSSGGSYINYLSFFDRKKKVLNSLKYRRFLKNLTRRYIMFNHFVASASTKKKEFVTFKTKLLQRILVYNYNINLVNKIGFTKYKKLIYINYKLMGLNFKKSILLIENYFNNYYLKLNKVNNNIVLKPKTTLNISKYDSSFSILNTYKSNELIYILDRMKIYNFLSVNLIKYLFLNYKRIFFMTSGLLKNKYLTNCSLYIYFLKGHYLTSTLISDYISRNLKAGHSLNKVLAVLMRHLSENLDIYLGWKIGGFGRFQRRGRARKQWFCKGQIPFSMVTSNLDYDSRAIQLRNGICNVKVFLVKRKKFYYNI